MAGGEEFVEVGADAVKELAGGVGEGSACGDESGGVFGEAVEAVAVFFVGVAAGAEGSVWRVAGAPDLEGFADVVAGVAEEEREGRDGAVPVGTLEDGAAAGAEEVAAGEEGAAAGRAGRGVDEGVAEESAFAGDAVDVGRVDEFVDGALAVDGGVGAGVAAPVVGEAEEDVERAFGICVEREEGAEQEEGEPEHGEEVGVEGRWCEPESYPQTRVGWERGKVSGLEHSGA